MRKYFIDNWKTSATGIGLLLGAAGDIAQQLASAEAWNVTHLMADYTAVVTGIGLLFAADAKGK